jgi:hypothetical protein
MERFGRGKPLTEAEEEDELYREAIASGEVVATGMVLEMAEFLQALTGKLIASARAAMNGDVTPLDLTPTERAVVDVVRERILYPMPGDGDTD